MTQEEKYMARCIQLAKNGQVRVRTNPMVGAVLVADGKIIGEGYHACYGCAHAEVNAIGSVRDESLLRKATLYVSLEPCAHYGKTPPCAQLIIDKAIPRVVVGCLDPFPEVAGRGIRMLRDAGVEVTVGVCEAECKNLICRFVTYNMQKRPYVILKWAQSADGYLDYLRQSGAPVRLSTALTSMLVHKRRAEADAILVGTNTAELDNPTLTVRHWFGRNPLRVVIDRHARLSPSLHLFSDGLPTLCFTNQQLPDSEHVSYIRLDSGRPVLPQVLASLHDRGIQSVLVEGGAGLLQSFIASGLWDEAYVEQAGVRLNGGVKAPDLSGNPMEEELFFGVPIHVYTRAVVPERGL